MWTSQASLPSRERATRRRLQPPEQRAVQLPRESVLRSLSAARHNPLTLVVAPPGFGKTTVVSQWWDRLGSEGIARAWYSAAVQERDPVAFLGMVSAALATAGLDCPTYPDIIGDLSVTSLLDAILSALDRVGRPFVLVIDDFERIDCAPIARMIEALLEGIGPDIHILLSARRKPGLALAAWRMQGLVRIIDPDDLALSRAEIAEALSLPETSPEVLAFAELTQGWPAAVQLYRLWRGRGGERATPDGFSGRVDEVADYLAERVFNSLPDECRALLIDLSFLEYVEVGLADAVRGRSDSGGLLELAKAELGALVHQANAGGVDAYRLHPLLASFAYGELERRNDHLNGLRTAAAEWLWDNGHFSQAIRHYVDANRIDRFLDRFARLSFVEIFLTRGTVELRLLLREIPAVVQEGQPRIRMMAALVHFKAGLFGEARAMLSAIRDETGGYAVSPDGDPEQLEMEGLSLEILFDTYMFGMHAHHAATCARITALARDVPLMWAWCHNTTLVVDQFLGHFDMADQNLQACEVLYEAQGVRSFALQHLEMHRILIALGRGVLHQAAKQAGAIVRRRQQMAIGIQDPGLNAMARMTMALVDYHQNYRLSAADLVAVGLGQFDMGEAWFDHYAFAWQVMLDAAWRRQGMEGVTDQINRHRSLVHHRGCPVFDPLLDGYHVTYLVLSGEIERAAGEAAARGLHRIAAGELPSVGAQSCGRAQIALSLLALKQGNSEEALRIAERLLGEARANDRLGSEIESLILSALAHEQAGRSHDADSAFRVAIRRAVSDHWLSPFAIAGAALLPLVVRCQEAGVGAAEAVLLQRIADVIRAQQQQQRSADPSALNEREAAIIAHIAEGASNKLVARRLGISDNTVKFHLKKIYAKLGVSTRQAAVARAMER